MAEQQSSEQITDQIVRDVLIRMRDEGLAETADRFAKAEGAIGKFGTKIDNVAGYVDKAHNQVYKLRGAVEGLEGTMQGVTGAFTKFLAIGGVSVSLENAAERFLSLDKDIISLSGSMSKYGKGINEVRGNLESMSSQLALTRKDTLELFKAYERGFPYATFQGAESLLKNIQNVTANNVEEMRRYQSVLQGIAAEFPGISKSIERLDSADKARLDSLAKQKLIMGQMSLSQYKDLQNYINQNKQVSAADKKALDDAKKRQEAVGKIKNTFEGLALTIGGQLVPVVEKMSHWFEQNKFYVSDILKAVAQIAPYLLVAKTAGMALSGVLGGVSGGIRGISGLTSILGMNTWGGMNRNFAAMAAGGGMGGRGGIFGSAGAMGPLAKALTTGKCIPTCAAGATSPSSIASAANAAGEAQAAAFVTGVERRSLFSRMGDQVGRAWAFGQRSVGSFIPGETRGQKIGNGITGALVGAGTGYAVGKGYDALYRHFTGGKDADATFGGSLGKSASMIAAGFATGGVAGGIGATLARIAEFGYKTYQTIQYTKDVRREVKEASAKMRVKLDDSFILKQVKGFSNGTYTRERVDSDEAIRKLYNRIGDKSDDLARQLRPSGEYTDKGNRIKEDLRALGKQLQDELNRQSQYRIMDMEAETRKIIAEGNEAIQGVHQIDDPLSSSMSRQSRDQMVELLKGVSIKGFSSAGEAVDAALNDKSGKIKDTLSKTLREAGREGLADAFDDVADRGFAASGNRKKYIADARGQILSGNADEVRDAVSSADRFKLEAEQKRGTAQAFLDSNGVGGGKKIEEILAEKGGVNRVIVEMTRKKITELTADRVNQAKQIAAEKFGDVDFDGAGMLATNDIGRFLRERSEALRTQGKTDAADKMLAESRKGGGANGAFYKTYYNKDAATARVDAEKATVPFNNAIEEAEKATNRAKKAEEDVGSAIEEQRKILEANNVLRQAANDKISAQISLMNTMGMSQASVLALNKQITFTEESLKKLRDQQTSRLVLLNQQIEGFAAKQQSYKLRELEITKEREAAAEASVKAEQEYNAAKAKTGITEEKLVEIDEKRRNAKAREVAASKALGDLDKERTTEEQQQLGLLSDQQKVVADIAKTTQEIVMNNFKNLQIYEAQNESLGQVAQGQESLAKALGEKIYGSGGFRLGVMRGPIDSSLEALEKQMDAKLTLVQKKRADIELARKSIANEMIVDKYTNGTPGDLELFTSQQKEQMEALRATEAWQTEQRLAQKKAWDDRMKAEDYSKADADGKNKIETQFKSTPAYLSATSTAMRQMMKAVIDSPYFQGNMNAKMKAALDEMLRSVPELNKQEAGILALSKEIEESYNKRRDIIMSEYEIARREMEAQISLTNAFSGLLDSTISRVNQIGTNFGGGIDGVVEARKQIDAVVEQHHKNAEYIGQEIAAIQDVRDRLNLNPEDSDDVKRNKVLANRKFLVDKFIQMSKAMAEADPTGKLKPLTEKEANKMVDDYSRDASGKDKELAAKQLDAQKRMNEELGKEIQERLKIGRIYDMQLRLQEQETQYAQNMVQLADSLAVGIGANASQRLQVAGLIQNQINTLDKQIADYRVEQEKQRANHNEQAALEIEEKINDALLKRQQKELEIVSITKTLRDGWVSLMSAETNASGRITKIMVDSNHNLALAARHLGMLRSSKSGAVTGPDDQFRVGTTESQGFMRGPDGGLAIRNPYGGVGYIPTPDLMYGGIPATVANQQLINGNREAVLDNVLGRGVAHAAAMAANRGGPSGMTLGLPSNPLGAYNAGVGSGKVVVIGGPTDIPFGTVPPTPSSPSLTGTPSGGSGIAEPTPSEDRTNTPYSILFHVKAIHELMKQCCVGTNITPSVTRTPGPVNPESPKRDGSTVTPGLPAAGVRILTPAETIPNPAAVHPLNTPRNGEMGTPYDGSVQPSMPSNSPPPTAEKGKPAKGSPTDRYESGIKAPSYDPSLHTPIPEPETGAKPPEVPGPTREEEGAAAEAARKADAMKRRPVKPKRPENIDALLQADVAARKVAAEAQAELDYANYNIRKAQDDVTFYTNQLAAHKKLDDDGHPQTRQMIADKQLIEQAKADVRNYTRIAGERAAKAKTDGEKATQAHAALTESVLGYEKELDGYYEATSKWALENGIPEAPEKPENVRTPLTQSDLEAARALREARNNIHVRINEDYDWQNNQLPNLNADVNSLFDNRNGSRKEDYNNEELSGLHIKGRDRVLRNVDNLGRQSHDAARLTAEAQAQADAAQAALDHANENFENSPQMKAYRVRKGPYDAAHMHDKPAAPPVPSAPPKAEGPRSDAGGFSPQATQFADASAMMGGFGGAVTDTPLGVGGDIKDAYGNSIFGPKTPAVPPAVPPVVAVAVPPAAVVPPVAAKTNMPPNYSEKDVDKLEEEKKAADLEIAKKEKEVEAAKKSAFAAVNNYEDRRDSLESNRAERGRGELKTRLAMEEREKRDKALSEYAVLHPEHADLSPYKAEREGAKALWNRMATLKADKEAAFQSRVANSRDNVREKVDTHFAEVDARAAVSDYGKKEDELFEMRKQAVLREARLQQAKEAKANGKTLKPDELIKELTPEQLVKIRADASPEGRVVHAVRNIQEATDARKDSYAKTNEYDKRRVQLMKELQPLDAVLKKMPEGTPHREFYEKARAAKRKEYDELLAKGREEHAKQKQYDKTITDNLREKVAAQKELYYKAHPNLKRPDVPGGAVDAANKAAKDAEKARGMIPQKGQMHVVPASITDEKGNKIVGGKTVGKRVYTLPSGVTGGNIADGVDPSLMDFRDQHPMEETNISDGANKKKSGQTITIVFDIDGVADVDDLTGQILEKVGPSLKNAFRKTFREKGRTRDRV